jgi:hypothetical protein
MDQIRKYHLPPSPTKDTDARYVSYIRNFEAGSWELDALEPRVITKLIQREIVKVLDMKRWKESNCKEELDKGILAKVVEKLNEDGGV